MFAHETKRTVVVRQKIYRFIVFSVFLFVSISLQSTIFYNDVGAGEVPEGNDPDNGYNESSSGAGNGGNTGGYVGGGEGKVGPIGNGGGQQPTRNVNTFNSGNSYQIGIEGVVEDSNTELFLEGITTGNNIAVHFSSGLATGITLDGDKVVMGEGDNRRRKSGDLYVMSLKELTELELP